MVNFRQDVFKSHILLKDGHIGRQPRLQHIGMMMGSRVSLLFDVPEPRRMASLPVASIVETIADGGANNKNASAYIHHSAVNIKYE